MWVPGIDGGSGVGPSPTDPFLSGPSFGSLISHVNDFDSVPQISEAVAAFLFMSLLLLFKIGCGQLEIELRWGPAHARQVLYP